MNKIKVWYSMFNLNSTPCYFLHSEEAEKHQEQSEGGYLHQRIGIIETYVGSDSHKQAIKNTEDYYEQFKQ